ncbi:MAG: glycosyltransferase, partial [Patescibacteria group bacterium]|nr:glycosyltransferase [Patescibacteria group bacterium]
MKISVDFGAVEGKGYFGTKIFAVNFKKAAERYDKKNKYLFYDFKTVKPRIFWSQFGLSLAEWKNKPDVFLALNQSIPFYTHAKIISFCHGLSYYFFPRYYSKKDKKRLNHQLDQMIKRSDIIVVSSVKVKNELEEINKSVYKKNLKILVIPFGIPFDVLEFKKKEKIKEKFFLVVANNQPIKNINFSIKAFLKLNKIEKFKNYFLYVITNSVYGLIKGDNIRFFVNNPREKLINFYSQTQALLTASFYESFNFPVIETLAFGNPVIALESAVIPEVYPYVNTAKDEKEFIAYLKSPKIKPD